MKKILLILLLNYFAFGNPSLKFESLISDFYGLAFNQNTVIAYGNCGIILRSNDLGYSWEQLKIAHDSTLVKRIKFYNGIFYGVVDNGSLLTSTDDGRNWKNLDFSRHFYDLDISDDKLYVLSDSNLLTFDLNLNNLDNFNLNLKIKPNECIVVQNHLIIPSDTNKIKIVDLVEKKIIKEIDFKQLGFTTISVVPKRFIRNGNSIYLYTGESIVKSDDGGLNWLKSSSGASMFQVHENTIFSLYPVTYDLANQMTTPNLSKYNGSSFSTVTSGTVRRYVKNQPFSDFDFLTDDIILGVGSNKTIYRSTDKGNTWNLISHISSVWLSYWKDKNYGAVFLGNGQVFITKNGGTTWLPQINNDSNIRKFSYADLIYLTDDGTCFIYKTGINYSSNTNIMISKDSGTTFKQVLDDNLNENNLSNKSFILKNNEYYFMYLNSKFIHLYCRLHILDKNFKQKDMILVSDSCNFVYDTFRYQDGKYTVIAYQRMNPKILFKDTLQVWKFTSPDGIKWEKDYLATIRGRIIHIRQFDENNLLFLMFDLSDSMVTDTNGFSSPKYEYKYALLYNNQFKGFDTVFNKREDDIFLQYSFIHEGKLWMIDWERMFNIDIDNLHSFKWDSLFTDPYNFLLNSTIINDEVLFLDCWTRLRNKSIIKITLSDKTNVKEKTEIRTQVYAYPPYPIPAGNRIKCKIYWDLRYDISDSKFVVHDISGNQYETEGKISLNQLQTYYGEMIWDCTGVPNGIYFISFTHGDVTKIIPVVIQR